MPRPIWLILALLVGFLAGCRESTDTQPRMTAPEAVAIAEPALAVRFPGSFEERRPYRAEYRDGIWHVRGTLPAGTIGGTPEAEVRDADGEILRIYHTQ